MAVLFVFLTFLDQLTKKIASMYLIGNDITIIPNILELHYLENKGAAWGLFQNSTWILGGLLISNYLMKRDFCFYELFSAC